MISDQQVREWNGPVVLLARFDKYVWSNNEVFSAKLAKFMQTKAKTVLKAQRKIKLIRPLTTF